MIVDVASGDTSAATVSPAALTFTPANWETAQTVTVTGVDDKVDNAVPVDEDQVGERTVTITHTPAGGGYGAEEADTVTVNVKNQGMTRVRAPTSKMPRDWFFLPKNRLSLKVNKRTYTVKLMSKPTGTVTVDLQRDSGRKFITISPRGSDVHHGQLGHATARYPEQQNR